MTAINVSLTHQNGAGRAPAVGRLSWRPTQRRTDGTVVILPTGSSVDLPAGTATVDLDPGVYWFVESVNGGESAYRVVPDAGPVAYADLAAVDPATLEPSAVPEAAWVAMAESTVTTGAVVGDDLVLTRTDGTSVNAGNVRGPVGPPPVILDLLTPALARPLYAAHRTGGGLVWPEQSMDGIEAAFRAGFAAEVDIKPLADGTLVLCHDDTVDRTMTGVTGNVSALTVAQWRDSARLKPVIPGGRKLLAPFWEDVLNVYGGRGIFFAEIKTNDNAAAQRIIDSILDRGLEGSIMILTFNSTHAQMAAAAGLVTMFITNTTDPATVASWGVQVIGVSNTATQVYVQSAVAAGLKVNVYSILTAAEAATRFSWGAWSITSDDPWLITGRYEGADKDPFARLESWPGQRNTNPNDFKMIPKPDGSVALYLKGNPSIRAPWAGPIPRPSRVLSGLKFGAVGVGQGTARFYFATTKDLHGTAQEGTTDNWYMAMVRRSGNLEVYRRVGGVSTQLVGAGSANPMFPVLADSTAGADMSLQMDLTAAGIEVTNLISGAKMTYTDASLAGPFYLNLSLGGGAPQPEAEYRNIMRMDLP